MSLSTIRAELASDMGIKIDSQAQKDYLNDKINKAAQEIWDTYDLRNSLREQIFLLDTDQQLVTLPFYVSRLRKMRTYDYMLHVKNVNMIPRYNYEDWIPPFLEWRVVRENSALSRDIENQGQLTLTLAAAATVAFSVTVVGKTPTAERYAETVNFAVGDITKNTTNNFEEVESICKNKAIDQDLVIYDMDSNQVSAIPNAELKARFTIVQVLDRYQTFGEQPLVEVLYKTLFTPFRNDADEFPCGSQFDRAIYWKTIEHLASKQDGDDAMKRVIGAQAKCDQVIKRWEANNSDGQENRLEFAPCPYYGLFSLPTPVPWNDPRYLR